MNILFVDASRRRLEELARYFAGLPNTTMNLTCCASDIEARHLLTEHLFHLIISVERPAASGTGHAIAGLQLLHDAQQIAPGAVRFLLAADPHAAAEGAAQNLVHRYLHREVDPADLLRAATQVQTLVQLMGNQALGRILSDIGSLPSISSDYQRVLQAINDPYISLRKLGALVAGDLSMTAQVLRFANSAFVAASRSISSPQQAVVLLGLDTTRSLITATKVLSTFQSARANQLTEAIYRHSLIVGLCAQRLVQQMGGDVQQQNDALVAGLLHDLGKLILVTYLAEQHDDVLRRARLSQIPPAQAEYDLLGISHAEIGGYWIGLCGLPDEIVQAVAFHHKPGLVQGTAHILLTAVHVADVYLNHAAAERMEAGQDKNAEANEVPGQHTALDLDFLTQQGSVERLPEWQQICLAVLSERTKTEPTETKPTASERMAVRGEVPPAAAHTATTSCSPWQRFLSALFGGRLPAFIKSSPAPDPRR